MASIKLTKRVLDNAEAKPERYDLWDASLAGFGVRISPSGSKSFFASYRTDGGGRAGRKVRHTLGSYGVLTVEEARSAAQRVLADVRLGANPAAERQRKRAAPTVQQLADLFLDGYVRPMLKPRTAHQYDDILNRLVVPEIGTSKAETITRGDIAKLHKRLGATQAQANRMLAVVGSMYAYGSKVGLIPEGMNPVRGIGRYREQGKERFLSEEELSRLGAALVEAETVGIPWDVDESKPGAKHLPKKAENRLTRIGPEAAAAIRLLIFTGARLREILDLQWDHVDMGRGLLMLPDSKTGKKAIILGAPAIAVLQGLPRIGDFVIPGMAIVKDDGSVEHRPRHDLKKPWAAVSKQAGLKGVRLHDLRHTFASYAAGGGVGLPIIGSLLGHKTPATTAKYAHLANDPVRRAAASTTATIAAAMGVGAKSAEVVAIRG